MGEIQDGTASFAVRDKRIKALVDFFFPVGSIIARDDDTKPEILSYGKWEKIGENRVLQGAGGVTGEAGQDVEPGLPNITGSFVVYTDGKYLGQCKGAFTAETTSLNGESNVLRGSAPEYDFDASKSNPIYGSSDTMQPPAHIVTFWKRIE